MRAATVVKQCALARLDIYAKDVALNSVLLVRDNDDTLVFLTKAKHILNHPRTAGQLALQLSLLIIYIKVVVAVALTLENEHIVIPRQKLDGVQRLHVFVTGFAV